MLIRCLAIIFFCFSYFIADGQDTTISKRTLNKLFRNSIARNHDKPFSKYGWSVCLTDSSFLTSDTVRMFNHNTHYEKLCCEGTDLQFFKKHFCYKRKTHDCVGLCSSDVSDPVWHMKLKNVDNELHLKITKTDKTTYDLVVLKIEYIPTDDHNKHALLTFIKAH